MTISMHTDKTSLEALTALDIRTGSADLLNLNVRCLPCAVVTPQLFSSLRSRR